MKKLLLLLTLPLALFGQSLERQVIAGSGADFTTANLQVSATLGEVMTRTFTSSTVLLTQGFQQAELTVTTGFDHPLDDFTFKAYPVPAQDILTLDFTSPDHREINLHLVDLQGRILPAFSRTLQVAGNTSHQMNLSGLSSGAYLIRIDGRDVPLGNLRILKIE